MKLVKDIRDSLRGGVRPLGPDDNNDNDNDDNNDNDNDDDNDDDNDNNDNDDDDDDDGDKISKRQEFVSPLLEEIYNKKYTNDDDDDDDESVPDLKTEKEEA